MADDPVYVLLLFFGQLSKDGVAEFRIDVTSEIKHHPSRPWFPDGRRLQIEADVIEQATGKKESVIDNEIYFTKSPFQILVDDTPKYFKPALPFVIRVSFGGDRNSQQDSALEYFAGRGRDYSTGRNLELLKTKAGLPCRFFADCSGVPEQKACPRGPPGGLRHRNRPERRYTGNQF